jgi:O-methyltransferase involved in polyketide biosynthesis
VGFDPGQPSFIIWLGVIYYLIPEAAIKTLAVLGGVRGAVEIVFDYFTPTDPIRFMEMPIELREAILAQRRRVAEWGEPLRNFLEPDALQQDLRRCGFTDIEDLAPRDIFVRFAGALPPTIDPARGWHFIHARKAATSFVETP